MMPKKTHIGANGGRLRKAVQATFASPAEKTIEPDASNRPARGNQIVGIGASAGGLKAFKAFFEKMPPDTGMAFVLVQHLAPDHKSILVELLGKATGMPVVEAEDDVVVAPNTVYIIPPDATLTLKDRRLRVARPAPPREHRRPIDTFFYSLAEDQGENAVCIVLSGTGSDGTLGLKSIKEQGGLTLAQAGFDRAAMSGMPLSAAATGQVDHVMAVADMPAKLVEYQQHLLKVAPRKDGDGNRLDATEYLAKISALLRAQVGHDFSKYKETTIVRRVQRRMQVLQIDTVPAYIARLKEDPQQIEMLFRDLLIGVTEFFRDPEAFGALQTMAIPKLLENMGANDQVRIWVPACATGEEVYSIAILMREALHGRPDAPSVQIFGTDIDDNAVAVARSGRYRKTTGLSPERLGRWFTEIGEDRFLVKAIREMCIFSTHSVVKDPPFSKLDLVSCRNLLIYMDHDLQDRVLQTLHYALKPNGILFLAPAEGVTQSKLFDTLDKEHRIFQRSDSDAALPTLAPPRAAAPRLVASIHTIPQAGDWIERNTRRVLEKYSPVHLVVDKHHDIIRFSGGEAGRYLEPSSGAASLNLFDILRKALRPAVRAGLQTALATNGPSVTDDVQIKIDGKSQSVTVIVEPIAEKGAALCVVMFQDAPERRDAPAPNETEAAALRAVEHDLRTTKAQLQSAIDDLEMANEETKSAAEEYQSVNEEMQSANEELETSQAELQSANQELETSHEEMQAINEELLTVNSELASKNDALKDANGDLKNLLDSTKIATIFLDNDLCIKNFTPGMTDIFNLRDSDRGRPVTDLTTVLSYAGLTEDAKETMRSLSVVEREVQYSDKGMTFLMRIRPYRTVDDVVNGVVITFVDITARKLAENLLREHASIVEFFPDALVGVTLHGVIRSWNPAAALLFGYSKDEAVGQPISLLARAEKAQEQSAMVERAASGKVAGPMETMGRRKDGGEFHADLTIMPIREAGGTTLALAVAIHDITDRRRARDQRLMLQDELNHRVKNTLATVQSIAMQTFQYAQTRDAFQGNFSARLIALSKTHNLLMRDNWEGASLRDLLSQELEAYRSAESSRFVIRGEDVQLEPRFALAFGMVFHELATNAAKYGALSVPTGCIDITWTLVDSGAQHHLLLDWVESGGPRVEKSNRRGMGSRLIEDGLAYELEAEARIDFNPAGVHYRVDVPIAQPEQAAT